MCAAELDSGLWVTKSTILAELGWVTSWCVRIGYDPIFTEYEQALYSTEY